ncbi:S-adenosylmethionine--tRNA ribosyltransferase-isomerase [Abditibacterium utsteinense]|uniref:S-adenosylmethionine:tRNA ribosyltransferase-isomerase n=1 Tax=Abditibacterium utsteinense TaxID=1960156 RepID=A0A2S8SR18_9BACT|nr:tRNA preQ1(34) S-adenosylmethionine ribosyltransferase-isomerase QueA [Abditibacterium utsteinense]PQV63254.1 S-adenosylmethionine--tRNA ribosyltransferase-isomerase [Abditibacterium utsteinense]
MLASELDFDLPEHFIAQTPVEPRDAAKLLVFRRASGQISHHFVRDLPALLRPSDLLIFNDTRVLRARLRGFKPSGGRVEALLLKEITKNRWQALLKPSARLQAGGTVEFVSENSDLHLSARLEARLEDAWILEFHTPKNADIRDFLPTLGEVPLPPYIRQSSPEARYQTTFSRQKTLGNPLDSAAAPTAGLHFTPQLLENLEKRGIDKAFLTLAVGAGTFRPVQSETLEEHRMHREEFEISVQSAQKINEQKARGGRIVAVGTTSVRALESVADERGFVAPGEAATQIFIRPGHVFRGVDALLTNFHQPRSTLLALVAAFIEAGTINKNGENGSKSGLATIREIYALAMKEGYRFHSFGDAMLLD